MDYLNIIGSCCQIECEFIDENGNIPDSLIGYRKNNEICIKRSHIRYNITINSIRNAKRIYIESDTSTSFDNFFQVVMTIFRFENLFEGKFFRIKTCIFDQIDMLYQVNKHLIGYAQSTKNMSCFYELCCFTNVEYKRLYCAFDRYLQKHLLQYHISLFAAYLNNAPADMRLAQFLEVFEPMADEMYSSGKINLSANPFRLVSKRCKCGRSISARIPNKGVHFEEKITALVNKFGKDIFKGDSISKVVKKAVVTRNKVDHASAKRNAMTGGECAFYLFKFFLLYRVIIMQEMGISYDRIRGRVMVLTEDFNKRFADYRIRP